MEIGKNAIIVIGSGDIKMELAMARLKEEHPELIIVTNPEEAKKLTINEIIEKQKAIPITMGHHAINHLGNLSDGQANRRERRKQKRKK
jgi:glycerate-2-kinase